MKTTTFEIIGMTCEHCVATAVKAIEGVGGVTGLAVSLENKNAVVTHSDEDGVVDLIVKAISEAGFKASR